MMRRVLLWCSQNRLLIILFGIGAIVRILYAGTLPPGLNQDEASIGYDAFSILHYGIDRNGVSMPIHLIAWGSGQNALYAYFSMPFIYLFGLNEWSVRAVAILFGIIGMVALYLISRRLFGNQPKAAVLAAFLIVICPWHIMMSRWSLESNLFPSLVLLAVLCLFKAMERPKWLIAFTVIISLSLYAYGTAYFFVPVFVTGIVALLLAAGKLTWRMLLFNGLAMAIIGLPILLFFLINRMNYGAIETTLFSIPKLTQPRVEQVSTVFQGDMLQELWHRLTQFLELYITQNDGLLWNAIPGFGYMYPIAVPFIVIGIISLAAVLMKERSIEHGVIAIWIVTAVLMALITDVNINRINIIFYPTVLLTAMGIWQLRKRVSYTIVIAAAAFSVYFVAFVAYYYQEYPNKLSPMFYESFGEAITYASQETEGNVYIGADVNMPYIYVLFYEQIDPNQFQATVKYSNPGSPFQQVQSFGRYYFERRHPGMGVGEEAAYIWPVSVPLPAEDNNYMVKQFKHYNVIIEKR